MGRYASAVVLLALALGAPPVDAQPAGRPARIGYIVVATAVEQTHLTRAFEDGMRELGYVEGRNVTFVRRYAGGRRERFPGLVAEILQQHPDLVYSAGSDIARTFKAAGPHVPVVFVVSDDPVASGVVVAMNRPGGMFTGVSMMSPELSGKRLELLAAALPALARVAMLYEPDHLAAYPADGTEVDALLHAADQAMYLSKRSRESA